MAPFGGQRDGFGGGPRGERAPSRSLQLYRQWIRLGRNLRPVSRRYFSQGSLEISIPDNKHACQIWHQICFTLRSQELGGFNPNLLIPARSAHAFNNLWCPEAARSRPWVTSNTLDSPLSLQRLNNLMILILNRCTACSTWIIKLAFIAMCIFQTN